MADVNSRGEDPSSSRALGTRFCSAAPVVNSDGDGQAVVQSGDGNLGSIFSAELHGCHLSGDGVVRHVVEGEGVGIHLVRKKRKRK